MNIGKFDDFMATLTPEIIEQITNDANLKASQMRQSPDLPERTWLGNQIAAIAFTYSLEILGLYHKWLEQQNQD